MIKPELKNRVLGVIRDNSETGVDIIDINRLIDKSSLGAIAIIIANLREDEVIISKDIPGSTFLKYFPSPTEEEVVLGIINEQI